VQHDDAYLILSRAPLVQETDVLSAEYRMRDTAVGRAIIIIIIKFPPGPDRHLPYTHPFSTICTTTPPPTATATTANTHQYHVIQRDILFSLFCLGLCRIWWVFGAEKENLMTIDVVLLQVSPDLGGGEFGRLGMVSLGPGGSEIDGHQISYIRRRREDWTKNFHVIGSAEPRLRGDAWRLMSVTD